MNGETKELRDAIAKISDERHKENLTKFEKIFDKLDKLPCGERKGFYTNTKAQLVLIWGAIGAIFLVIIKVIIK